MVTRLVTPLCVQACSVAPTAQAWLGVSACRLATGDAAAASLALTEAAALDPENPVVWGRAALLALKGGHKQEAANALKVRCTRALLNMWTASFLNSRPRA